MAYFVLIYSALIAIWLVWYQGETLNYNFETSTKWPVYVPK